MVTHQDCALQDRNYSLSSNGYSSHSGLTDRRGPAGSESSVAYSVLQLFISDCPQ